MKRVIHPRRPAVVAVLAGALLVSGCASPDDGGAKGGEADSGSAARANYDFGLVGKQDDTGKPVRGGTLTIAASAEARSLDPTKTIAHGASGGDALAAVYDVLVRYDEESATYEPWLAKSLTSSGDHKTWTLKLRDDVTFSDGTPLDAKAVAGSIGHYMKNRGSDAALLVPNLADMEVEDSSTVVFRLRNSWSTFPSMLAQGAGMIVAPAAIAGDKFKPVGAGPFELGKYSPQEELVLRARKDYWHGAPYLDRVRFIWPQSDGAKLDAMESRSADVAYLRDPKVVDEAVKTDLPGYLVQNSLGNLLLINNREGRPGADIRVRRAIAHAMDAEANYQRAFGGAGLPGKEIFQKGSRWHTGVPPLPVDVAKAKKLLAAAKKDGYNGELTYLDGTDPTSRAEALATKAMLEQVGFTVKFDQQRSIADQIQKTYIEHDFDVSKNATSVSEADPYQRLNNFLNGKSALNATGYGDPKMDKWLGELQESGTDAERKAALTEIEKLWHRTVPSVNLGSSATFLPWQENVHGIVPTAEHLMLLGGAWKAE